MKKTLLAFTFFCLGHAKSSALRYEHKVPATVESIIQGDLNRSRIIEITKDFTTERFSEKNPKQS
ncbi:MAG: hypothetical protein MI784_15205, partial [Cytophagales bacterium]|nr:hypothetical protein [Cytophagales bacterium]